VRFTFNEGKAGEAAAYLLKWGEDPMGQMKLIKLLYLADRRAFEETGFPITGDQIAGLPKGPVLSETLNLIKGNRKGRGKVAEYVRPLTQDEGVRSVKVPSDEPAFLSRFDMRILRAVHEEFGHLTGEELKDWLHRNAEEWTRPPNNSRTVIDPAAILKAVGKSDEEVAEIAAEADYYFAIEGRLTSQ
jgi:uncharacterized phage-associated protein